MLNLEVDGDKLRTAREAAGMRVSTFAAKVGCSIWNIYRIEAGRGQPSADTYDRMRTALGLSDTDLLVDEETVA